MNAIQHDPAGDLAAVSRTVLLGGQAPSGAYVASPTFSQYGFGWLRDGAYCALALHAIGEDASVERFHRWIASVVLARADQIRGVIGDLSAGRTVPQERMLPTRYHLDGSEERDAHDEWPNFQLDGYGTWLFSVLVTWGADTPDDVIPAVRLAADYVAATWHLPCFDYWEEFGDRQHTSTLAALAAGMRAAARILGERSYEATADDIVACIEQDCVVGGVFVKGPEDDRVDASLVSLSTPFALFAPDDPRMGATIARIRQDLSSPSGGIRRYVGDDYYGGSPWVLLTAWLGWHGRLSGDEDLYREARAWVEGAVSAAGTLPEQITSEPQLPEFVARWEEQWGPVADPLLWSHAKYLLMCVDGGAVSWS